MLERLPQPKPIPDDTHAELREKLAASVQALAEKGARPESREAVALVRKLQTAHGTREQGPLGRYLADADTERLAEALGFIGDERQADMEGANLTLSRDGKLMLGNLVLMEWEQGAPQVRARYPGPWR
jgi:hypothetical protein